MNARALGCGRTCSVRQEYIRWLTTPRHRPDAPAKRDRRV